MKHVRRWVCRIVLLCALVVAIAAVAIWIRSYSTVDTAGFERSTASPPWSVQALLTTTSGSCVVEYLSTVFSHVQDPNHIPDAHQWDIGHSPNTNGFSIPAGSHHLLGFGFDSQNQGGPMYFFGVGMQSKELDVWFPLWSVILLSVAIAVAAFIKLRRDERPGQCRGCGYELRATPERCPECGETNQALLPRKSTLK